MPKKRSVKIAGHPTSITLEDPFWKALKDIAKKEKTSVNALITKIDHERDSGLSSAIRVYVLKEIQTEKERP